MTTKTSFREFLMGGATRFHRGICFADGEGMEGQSGGGTPAPSQAPASSGSEGGAGNNGQGNSGGNQNNAGTQNNTGPGFDPATFWNDPKGSNSTDGTNGQGGGQTPEQVSQEFANRLQGMTFGDIFTPKIAEEVANGNLTGVNAAIAEQLKSAAHQSVVLTAQLMQRNNDSLLAKVGQMIDQKFGGRDDADTLIQNFPSAKDPAVRPMVEAVFAQAMKLSGNNRAEAVKSTRIMLQHMGKAGAADMGINNPPPSAGGVGNANDPGVQQLLDDLLGRN